jgi:hypothetical protein
VPVFRKEVYVDIQENRNGSGVGVNNRH